MITLRLDGASAVQQRLAAAPAQVRRVVIKALAKRILANSKARIRMQSDLNQQAFTPRKSTRRKKMLTKLGQRLSIRAVSDTEALIGWASSVEGRIAAKQQLGSTETYTAALNRQQARRLPVTAPATRIQAKQLLGLGYKVRRQNGGWKTPTMKWITENLTIGQAGLLIKELKGVTAGQSWQIVLPPRSFLGVTDSEAATILNQIVQLPEVQAALNGF
ncbi:phage virion morphogenesis protein [Methylovulum psychrotolerans]|uniref:Virion morphogenesis protein n=1 Tax=Methylovulum psychrotolerans TaxID=1704499 RepID=A0A2S5CGH2_9GAMM|nr:phage virion morphogenesis protein [Methylovulum psychrotolerans]POZ49899.1 hypothetical protein AADEFJLK_04345 [Methylovulum psychrotolerans]